MFIIGPMSVLSVNGTCIYEMSWAVEYWLIEAGWRICVSKLTIIGLDYGLSPGRRQAIIQTNAGILLTGPLGTYFSEILIEIYIFSLNKMHLKMSSGKWRPFCLGLNVLKERGVDLSANN